MCCFHEWVPGSINNIFIHEKKNIFNGNDLTDIGLYNSYFQIIYFNIEDKWWYEEDIKNNIFKWSNGKVFKLYESNNTINSKEYMYIHLQKRNMENSLKDSQCKEFYIVHDKFIDCDNNIEQKLISKYKYLTTRH